MKHPRNCHVGVAPDVTEELVKELVDEVVDEATFTGGSEIEDEMLLVVDEALKHR